MPVDYAGNTLPTARALDITPSPQTFKDWVGSLDTNDYYSFSLSGRSSFNLKLDGMTANADVRLLNSSGKVVASGIAGNTGAAESINSTLEKGNYYIQVFPVGTASTYYNLSVSATPVDYAGNTITDARNITVNSIPTTYQDWVGSADLNDSYRFTLSNSSDLKLTLNGLSADADVKLLQLDSTGKTIQVGGQLGVSATSGTTAEAINLNSLAAGTYVIQVYQFSGDTYYNVSLSATPSVNITPGNLTQDWFNKNLVNPTIQSLTRSLATDGLTRNEMLQIFRAAEDGDAVNGVIDATELKDLRTIVSNTALFKMSNTYDYDYVRVLSNKIVNGDIANTTYQGAPLGNLYAGSSATQLEKLIGQWFLGSDRPVAQSSDKTVTYSYKNASGSLFQNGIGYPDIKQGDVGNCYFLAGLGEAALYSPNTIKSMFIDNGDNTYTVRFYNNGVADYMTVDRYLPTDASGRLVYASTGSLYNSSSNELWVALAEKAYAQLNSSGWIGQDNTNSYQGIEGGWDGYAFSHITGNTTGYYGMLDFNSMVNYFNSGNWVGVSSKVSGVASNVVPNHAYVVTDYNASTKTFTLFNPWGVNGGYYDSNGDGVAETFKPGTVELSYSQLIANFDGWTYTFT
ncbi:MAG TPA: C2 family cysteine protease [Coleofasciculaceae cyanobacterium]|jgi:hypothetical protein